MPKVSVIIPTYNRQESLSRAIKSVLNQTYTDFELLVIQNGPQEHTKALVNEFVKSGAPIQYIYEPLANAANARNVGVIQSKGRYIAFLDDDDEWLPEKLRRQVEVLERDTRFGMVTCRTKRFKDASRDFDIIPRQNGVRPDLYSLIAKNYVPGSFSCVMIRKECFDVVGLFKIKYRICDDYEFYLRLATKYDIAEIDEPLVHRYWHCDSASRNESLLIDERVLILKEFIKSKELNIAEAALMESISSYSRNYYVVAQDAADAHRYWQAVKLTFRALSLDPLIGMKLPWGNQHSVVYKLMRPYAFLVFNMLLLWKPIHANS